MKDWFAGSGLLAVVLLGAGLVAVVTGWRVVGPRDGEVARPPTASRYSLADATRWIQLRNLALARLENGDFKPGVELLEALAAELPDEPTVATNLVVGYVLLLKTWERGGGPESEPLATARDKALQAVEHLLRLAGQSATSHILAAKVARLVSDDDRVLAELKVAADLAPADPVVPFELFQIGRAGDNPVLRREGAAALKRAHELQPDNLFVLTQLLWQQAAAHDTEITNTLTRLRGLVQPLIAESPRWERAELLPMLDKALTLAGATPGGPSDWNVLTAETRRAGNVVLAGTATQLDFRQLDRQGDRDWGELAFLQHDFSAAFHAATEPIREARAPAVAVKLLPPPAEQPLPPLSGVQALAVVDFDLDGRLDVVAVLKRKVEVYRRAVGGAWRLAASWDAPFELSGVAVADLDRDVPPRGAPAAPAQLDVADPDFVVFGPGGLAVLENRRGAATGKRTLEPVENNATDRLHKVLAVALADLDRDGDLDLAVATESQVSFWSNRSQLRLDAMALPSALDRRVAPDQPSDGCALVPVDWNGDRDLDVVVAWGREHRLGYFENHRHGQFHPYELVFPAKGWHHPAALGLTSGPGRPWNLILGGKHGVTAVPDWESVSAAPKRWECPLFDELGETPVSGLSAWDYDNDGCQDLVAWGPSGLSFWRGMPDGKFQPVSDLLPEGPRPVSACDVGDLDGDGDLDLVVATPDGLTWYKNEGGNQNHWLDVVLHPEPYTEQGPDLTVNMHGLGSLLELCAGPIRQRQVVARPVTHFGLGGASRGDVLRVVWTNGLACNRIEPESNQRFVVRQKLKGM